jgi:hypothetical protein
MSTVTERMETVRTIANIVKKTAQAVRTLKYSIKTQQARLDSLVGDLLGQNEFIIGCLPDLEVLDEGQFCSIPSFNRFIPFLSI